MVEILTKAAFKDIVKELDLTSAVCTYQRRRSTGAEFPDDFQVWVLSDEDFSNLSAVDSDADSGDWMFSPGDGCPSVDAEFYINGEPIMAWDGSERKSWCLKCDYATHGRCAGTEWDKDGCYSSHRYRDLIAYLNDELGVRTSMRTVFCVCAASMAKQNGMKLSELFQKYLG